MPEMQKIKSGKTGKDGGKKKGFPLAYLLFAVSFIVLGLCFIIFSSQAISVMCYLLGGFTLLAAAFNAVVALTDKRRGVKFWLRMVLCLFAILCGVVVIVSKETALEYIVAAAAFLVVIDVSFKLQTVVRTKSVPHALWWTVVVLILVCYAGAAFLLKFYNVEAARLMVGLLGGLLVADGVLNFLTPVYLLRAEKEKRETAESDGSDGSDPSEEAEGADVPADVLEKKDETKDGGLDKKKVSSETETKNEKKSKK